MDKNKKRYVVDLTDLLTGLGIGLCFSYWKIGLILIGISLITCIINISKEATQQDKAKEKN